MSRPDVSVVVPVYNEAPILKANLTRIASFLSSVYPNYEVIVVDDGSDDDSPEIVEQFASQNDRFHLVSYRPNRGKGYAVRSGFQVVTGVWTALVDADLELPIEMLPSFFHVQRQTGARIVVGSRRHPDSRVVYPRARMSLSKAYNSLVRYSFRLSLTDTQLGFKLIHSSVVEDAIESLQVKRFAFDLELLIVGTIRGVRIVEAPVQLDFSRPGAGRIGLSATVSILRETAGIWFRRYITGYYLKETAQFMADDTESHVGSLLQLSP